jgi:hypothetical protein
MNGVEDEVGTMGGDTRIYLLPSGALRSLEPQCNSSSLLVFILEFLEYYGLYGYLLESDVLSAL